MICPFYDGHGHLIYEDILLTIGTITEVLILAYMIFEGRKVVANVDKISNDITERKVDATVMNYLHRIAAGQGNFANEDEIAKAIGETFETVSASLERLERETRIERMGKRVYLFGKVDPHVERK